VSIGIIVDDGQGGALRLMIRAAIACLVFLLAFGLYLHNAAPTVYVGDSGEFITAAETLGVPHPPAFPTYVFVAHAFSRVIPWGNPGYRVNLVSAACGAATVSLLYGLLTMLGLQAAGGLLAALIFLAARAPSLSSQMAEVFALHGLLVAGLAAAILADRWILAGLLFGVGMGNHQTLLFVMPAALVYCAARRRWPDPGHTMRMIAAVVVGLLVYGGVMIRAAKHPLLNVGAGDSFGRLLRIMTRADYGSLTLALGEAPERSWNAFLSHMMRFSLGLRAELGWFGLAVLAFGFAVWLFHNRSVAGFLIAGFAVTGPFFFWLGNLPFDAQSSGLLVRFYVAPLVFAALLAGASADWLWARSKLLAGLLVLSALLLGFRSVSATSLRQDIQAWSYGRNNLRTLPPQALFVMDGGDDTFYSVAYLTQVEHRRPDIEFHDRGGVVFPGLYGDDFRGLAREEKDRRRTVVEKSLLTRGRPLVFSTMNDAIVPGAALPQRGLMYGSFTSAADMDSLYDLRGVAPWTASSLQPPADYRLRALLPFYAYQRAMSEARAEHSAEAQAFLRSAYATGSDILWLLPNLAYTLNTWGYAAYHQNRLEAAKEDYAWLARIRPGDASVWTNLGAVADRAGRLEEARKNYEHAIVLSPDSAEAHFNLAVCDWKQKRWPEVVSELTAVLQIDPRYPGAAEYLRGARMRMAQPPS